MTNGNDMQSTPKYAINTATIVAVVSIVSATILAGMDKSIPQILETVVVLVLGAGAGAMAGYGSGKSERVNGKHNG